MEHWPHDSPMDPPDMCDCNTTTEEGHDVPTFKIFDFGTAVVYPDPFSAKSPMAADNISKEDRHGKPGVVADSPASEGYEYSQPFCMVRATAVHNTRAQCWMGVAEWRSLWLLPFQ